MANFLVAVPNYSIANQIARLLNNQNRLRSKHSAQSILRDPATYFVELEGDRVVGCTGLLKQTNDVSKSFHTSVAPDKMGKGLGTKLMQIAVNNCKTPFIFGTIREDNHASLRMVSKLGFKPLARTLVQNHYIITVGRYI